LTLLLDEKIRAVDRHVNIDGASIIDAQGCFVSPGFIDLHIHGSGGADVMDATHEALETISQTLLQTGTTAFLATTMTMSRERIDAALENIREYSAGVSGAQIIGVHMEGPFINPIRHGAQDVKYVAKPVLEAVKPHTDIVKMITLAPEVEGGELFVKLLTEHFPHIILSIGHSEANYHETKESFGWGISHATHLFNAMPPYHHRDPGLVGAVLDSDVTCDVIADLLHLHPAVLRLVHRMKEDKLILITDAMRAGCMKCGTYELGGQEVLVKDGKATLQDGTLAGSILKMNEALRHMVDHTAMSLPQAVFSVTEAPSKKLRLNKGCLKEGYDADIVIFDEDFSIISTIVAGEVKYQRRM